MPVVLGMDILDAENLISDIFSNEWKKRIVLQDVERRNGTQIDRLVIDEWAVPLTQYLGHIYAPFGFSTARYITRTQLVKTNR